MADDSIPVKSLSKKQMQDLFHKCNFLVKIKTKELRQVLLRERHADPLKSGHPFCTHSQILSFQDLNQNEVIRAHQYLMPDGRIGASHMPDPLRIFIDGTIHKLEAKQTGK
jgi:hypothetical protein